MGRYRYCQSVSYFAEKFLCSENSNFETGKRASKSVGLQRGTLRLSPFSLRECLSWDHTAHSHGYRILGGRFLF